MVRTILWPTDLSRNSLKSVKHVVSLAEKYQAKIIMLYVTTDLASMFGGYAHEPGEHHLQHFQEWEVKQAKSKMQHICETELKACPNMEIRPVQAEKGKLHPAAIFNGAFPPGKQDVLHQEAQSSNGGHAEEHQGVNGKVEFGFIHGICLMVWGQWVPPQK
ncbi:MAG: universal stress protein [Deltaproteobacteria bacterium]|nr:universal stress protein [Deltaproteobacteria bacterium]